MILLGLGSNLESVFGDRFKNIDLAVIAEGEITLAEILEKMLDNNRKLPGIEVLKKIPGIALHRNLEESRERRLQKGKNKIAA